MKTFNKTIILLVLVLMLTTGFIQQPLSISVTIATATTGGFWHPIGISLGDLITSYIPGVTATVQATGGAIENLKLLSAGEADLVMAYDYQVARLNSGTLPAVSDSSQPVRIVLGLYEQPLHIVTRADSGITSVPDLKGKRVSTSVPDSGAEEQAGFVFKALGIDWDKDITRQKLGITESAAALKAGQIDAFFWSGALPSTASSNPALADLAADPGVKMVILPVSGSVAEMVMQANPGVFHSAMIKKGEYPGLSEDVETLAVTAVLATLDTLPDEKLTAILNAVFDHKTELSSVWKGAADLTPEKSVAVLAPETRKYLHPVAAAVFDQRETLYQIATINALRAGQYDGITTLGWLKQQGNLGFGTFDGLDGEMILLDGVVYQAKATGLVELPADDVETPFATVTWFDADITADLGVVLDMASLHAALDKLIERKDAFYAIRIDGLFQQVQVRSVPKQQKPYPELVTALENQTVFEYQNIEGTIVGFWCPDYMGEVNQQGYHLHFISGDHTRGGHLLEAAVTSAQVSLDETRMFDMALRPADD